MKQLRVLVLTILASLVLVGCDILSLHPLAKGDDIITNNKILGVWHEEFPEDRKGNARKISETYENSDSIYKLLTKPAKYEFVVRNTGDFTTYGIIKTAHDVFNGEVINSTYDYELELTRIDGKTWGSFRIGDGEEVKSSQIIGMHTFLIKANGFARIEISDEKLTIKFIEYNWFKDVLQKNRMKIDHEIIGSGDSPQIVLTANTDQLRKLMSRIDEVDEAFEEDAVILNRN